MKTEDAKQKIDHLLAVLKQPGRESLFGAKPTPAEILAALDRAWRAKKTPPPAEFGAALNVDRVAHNLIRIARERVARLTYDITEVTRRRDELAALIEQ